MNAVEILRANHKEVLALIDVVEGKSGAVLKSDDAFNKLKDVLKTGTAVKEQVFYPAMEGFNEVRPLIREAYSEHYTIDQLLNQLSALPQGDAQGKLAELKANIRRHVERIENQVLPAAERLLSRSDLEELGRKMEQMKSGRTVTASGKKK
ncbi:MAG: hemerythrin domain-containing protein [Acidobacteriota bacterium]